MFRQLLLARRTGRVTGCVWLCDQLLLSFAFSCRIQSNRNPPPPGRRPMHLAVQRRGNKAKEGQASALNTKSTASCGAAVPPRLFQLGVSAAAQSAHLVSFHSILDNPQRMRAGLTSSSFPLLRNIVQQEIEQDCVDHSRDFGVLSHDFSPDQLDGPVCTTEEAVLVVKR